MIFRILAALGSAGLALLLILIGYVVLDLYMSGHGFSRAPGQGDPGYYHVATVLVVAVPIGVFLWVLRSTRPR